MKRSFVCLLVFLIPRVRQGTGGYDFTHHYGGVWGWVNGSRRDPRDEVGWDGQTIEDEEEVLRGR